MDSAHRYLVASGLSAVGTAYGLRPTALPAPLVLPAYLATWHTTEVPLVSVAGDLAITGLAVRHGAVRTGSGRAGLAITTASLAGRMQLYRRGRQAGTVLEAALTEGLGPGYRSRIRTPAHPGPLAGKPPRRLPGRILRVRRRFAHAADIPYGPHGRSNHLDIWRRPDLPADAAAPILLQVPGGGWITGNKQGQAYPLMSHLAERGWICVSMSYRLSPRASWPAHIVDVKRALAWVKQHIADYGGDPRFVAITGGSAGGHLSALAALSPNDPAFQPGFEDVDTRVQAAVPFYGVYDWTPPIAEQGFEGFLLRFGIMNQPYAEAAELYERASPLRRVGLQAPPFFVLHGSHDTLAPVRAARLLVAELRRAGGPTVYGELPGAQHGFDIVGSPRAMAAAGAVERFLGVVYGDWTHENRIARAVAR